MNPLLLDILRCPRCRGRFALDVSGSDVPARDGASGSIEEGRLQCADCKQRHPIVDGVPRLTVEEGVVQETRRGFEYQWRLRQAGRTERPSTVYGYDIPKFMSWLIGLFASDAGMFPPGSWLLDAGCGSGEKARELALRFPRSQVLAMDLSGSLGMTARTNADVPNLHFVEANILFSPIRAESCAFVMSIGVLHHTTDTQRAFDAVASLVAPGGGLLTWIYPLPDEDGFWAALYRQRDRHFLGLGHRLPSRLTLALCHVYVALLFPFVLRFLKQQYSINQERFPIYPDHPTLRDLYQSSVFLSFDNVMPAHQFRHGRAEVTDWYRAHGFGRLDDRYSGFFYATR